MNIKQIAEKARTINPDVADIILGAEARRDLVFEAFDWQWKVEEAEMNSAAFDRQYNVAYAQALFACLKCAAGLWGAEYEDLDAYEEAGLNYDLNTYFEILRERHGVATR